MFLILFGWLSVIIFVIGIVYRIVKFATMPVNLRWEVYPVPHEDRDKRSIGASYMEEIDWAKKPPYKSLWGEIVEMGYEIFLLRKVREYNPYKIWAPSMAMHWGIYLLFIWVFLLLAENIFDIKSLNEITIITGIFSFILGASGCIILIIKRAANADLRLYTAPVDYFNLLFLFSIFATGFISWWTDPSFIYSRKYINNLISLNPSHPPFEVMLNFLLLELFLIYMPFTKLLHYVAKYFTFHHGLWDDRFKEKGSAIDKKIIKQLSYVVTWGGPHVVGGKTWLEEAQDYKLEEKK
jgi:nitrate reductase gamma subunit